MTKKDRALELGRTGKLTPRQISDRLNLRNSTRVRKWLEEAGIEVVVREHWFANQRGQRETKTGRKRRLV